MSDHKSVRIWKTYRGARIHGCRVMRAAVTRNRSQRLREPSRVALRCWFCWCSRGAGVTAT